MNWKEVFNEEYYTEDASFDTQLQAKVDRNDISVRVRFANELDRDRPPTPNINKPIIDSVLEASERATNDPSLTPASEGATNILTNSSESDVFSHKSPIPVK